MTTKKAPRPSAQQQHGLALISALLAPAQAEFDRQLKR